MKPWQWALGASFAVHLAVLATFFSPSPLKGERVGVRGGRLVEFTRVSLAARTQQPAPVAPAAPRPRRATPVAEVQTGASEPPDDGPAEVAGGLPVAQGAEVAGGLSVAPGPEVAGGLSVAQGPEVAGGPAAPEAAGGPAGPDVTALVHARLAAMADRCYPAAARRFQQRGTVQLSFCTDERGGSASATVTQSSGAELLDAAARGCVVERAAPFPTQAASRCFSVPVRFGARAAAQ